MEAIRAMVISLWTTMISLLLLLHHLCPSLELAPMVTTKTAMEPGVRMGNGPLVRLHPLVPSVVTAQTTEDRIRTFPPAQGPLLH